MKKLLISALALASLVACSKEELVVEQTPGTISFDQVYVGKATRAAEDPSTTMATLRAFDAWGFMDQGSGLVFDQQRVTSSDGTTWTYAPLQYWLPNHMYYFSAISPVDDQNVVVEKATGNNLYNGLGTISFTNVNGTTDLLYSATTVNTNGWVVGEAKQKVAFTFNHLLSKVKFSFTNGFLADNYSIVVKDIKMTVPGDGKLNVAVENWWDNTDDWKLGTTTATLEFGHMNYGARIGSGLTAESDYERLTIPAAAAQEYEVTFFVELYSGDVLAYSNALKTKISGAALNMGCAYNFTAKLDQTNIAGTELKPIEFEVVEVKEWENGNGYDGGAIDTEVIGVTQENDIYAALGMSLVKSDSKTPATEVSFRLLKDIQLSQFLTIDGEKVSKVTFDLNGKTLSSGLTASNSSYLFYLTNGAELNINGEGTVATAKVSNGHYSIPVWVTSGCTVNIYGGEYQNYSPSDLIYAQGNNAKVNIYGGYFKAGFNTDKPNGNQNDFSVLNLSDNSGASIKVFGGKFYGFDPANNLSENPAENFLKDGYISKVVAVSDDTEAGRKVNTYEVLPANTLQEVATAAELQNALNAGGENIVLTADITTEEPFYVTTTAVINLNGKTIKSNKDGFDVTGALTINGNGKVLAAQLNNSSWCAVFAHDNAVVTINGGEYKVGAAEGDYNDLIYARDNAVINVNGGKYYAKGATRADGVPFVLNLKDDAQNAEIIVKGGYFENFDPANSQTEPSGITNFVAEGYMSYKVDNNWYAVTDKITRVSTEDDLHAALAKGGAIMLTKNIESANPFIVEKDVVVNLAGYTVSVGVFTENNGTISKGNTDSYGFWVKGGNLTINGNGKVLTGACPYSMAVWANGGNVEINGGYFENAGEGSDLIYAKGNSIVTINGGEFKANEKNHNNGTNERYSALNCNDASYKAKTANFIVKGGKYFGFNPANNTSEGAGTNFVAEGYESVAEGDYYVVKAKAVTE